MTKGMHMPDLADLFPGYASEWINTKSGRIFARVGGNGPPVTKSRSTGPPATKAQPTAPPATTRGNRHRS